jgi:hypothetical protein
MRPDINVMGMFFTSLFIYMMIGIPVYLLARTVLFRLGAFNYIWHPNFFEFCLYTIVVTLLALLVPL